MKLIVNIPDVAYEAYKEWSKNGVATVEQSIIVDGKPYEERPQGKWLFDKENSFTIDMFKCSICGYFGDTHFKFCPDCGADMRGEE